MFKSIASKVAWVGRTASTMFGLALVMALMFGVATTAPAGTGVGARFQLGKTNTVDAITKLVGSMVGPSFRIDNNSTDASATTLDLQPEAGRAPLERVMNLGENRIEMRIPRSAWFLRDLRFPHS
jgi:ABC-type antimicrobial peptide transport system permease subunit